MRAYAMTYISKISSFMQFFLSITIFWAVFICSFSILRNIQIDNNNNNNNNNNNQFIKPFGSV